MLTSSQIETLRAGLVRQLAAVRRQIEDDRRDDANDSRDDLSAEGDETGDGGDYGAGLEIAPDAAEQRDEIRAIEDALARIAAHRYGLCADCTRPIDFALFTAYPTRTRCLKCEAAHERTERTRIESSP